MKVYFINENFDFVFHNNIKTVKNNVILNTNIMNKQNDNYFLNNIYYIIYINTSIKYCIPVKETSIINKIQFDEKNYDFFIDKNTDILKEYTNKFLFPRLHFDNYFSSVEKDKSLYKWYFYYFKQNVDILNLIQMFRIIQNNPIKNYIGSVNNIDIFKSKLTTYFEMLFGKYNIYIDVFPFYEIFLVVSFFQACA